MYRKWTKNDIEASKARFRRLYAKSPIEYRFLCGHDIQSEDDEDAYKDLKLCVGCPAIYLAH